MQTFLVVLARAQALNRTEGYTVQFLFRGSGKRTSSRYILITDGSEEILLIMVPARPQALDRKKE